MYDVVHSEGLLQDCAVEDLLLDGELYLRTHIYTSYFLLRRIVIMMGREGGRDESVGFERKKESWGRRRAEVVAEEEAEN